jgi:serine/threonine protein kinase/tetratricopeptide (TPR) repeat protein
VKTNGKRACPVCGMLFTDNSESCPVCALQGALKPESDSVSSVSSELRFEHYTVLQNADGTPFELGRGAMGVTYKAFDVHLRCPVALKIINARFIGDDLARHRFVREARAAASVRHPNVASVFHLGESAGNYFYVMEFVDGETLEKHIRRSGTLESDVALEVVAQVAGGLTAIQKQHLVHRDIKPSNIMVSWEEDRLENVKIIDLGLAKGVAEDTISTVGSFAGTPAYASPEQFAGLAIDIRSDLYSLGITLWEMLSGKPPFQGSAAELLGQHQHAAPPTDKLRNVPAPIVALLEVLLAKDPGQRFQSPAQLRKALPRVREAVASQSPLSGNELRSAGDQTTGQSPKRKPKKHAIRWLVASALGLAGLLLGWFFFVGHREPFFKQRTAEAGLIEKSIAVLPFESLSESKSDTYFADGVQGEILNNLAKIAQLKVISRTSVMQYRADAKRDLRQIAEALGVANVLEGTVRRDGNHVRVSTELVDARNDNTVWADSYDRDLSDIFAIQSEVAQTIAAKLTATLSPAEKRYIEKKPTENLEAYDLYLRAKELLISVRVSMNLGNVEKPLVDAIGFLGQAVRLDPKFTLAYCASAQAHDNLYFVYDPTPEQLALGNAAVDTALRLQPDLPEVHLAYASQLYLVYRDYERARVQLAIARRGLPNDTEAIDLGGRMDRRQGQFERAIGEFHEAITRDPRNALSIQELADTLYYVRQFRAAEQAFDRVIELRPDLPILKARKPLYVTFYETGDDSAVRSAIGGLPASMADDRGVLSLRLKFALVDRDWPQAKELIEKMKGGEDEGWFAYGDYPVPVGCYSIMLARLQGEQGGANSNFAETREQLNQKIQKSPENAAPLLSQLAVLDALLGQKEAAVAEAKRALGMLPISKDALDGPGIVMNLAVVYAWTSEADLAFESLVPLTKMPFGIFYGQLKRDPYWEPLRRDPRFDKLLAELAPRD